MWFNNIDLLGSCLALQFSNLQLILCGMVFFCVCWLPALLGSQADVSDIRSCEQASFFPTVL